MVCFENREAVGWLSTSASFFPRSTMIIPQIYYTECHNSSSPDQSLLPAVSLLPRYSAAYSPLIALLRVYIGDCYSLD